MKSKISQKVVLISTYHYCELAAMIQDNINTLHPTYYLYHIKYINVENENSSCDSTAIMIFNPLDQIYD